VWPLVLVLFALLDTQRQDLESLIRRAVAVPCIVVAISAFLGGWHGLSVTAAERIRPLYDPAYQAVLHQNLEYVSRAAGGERFDFIGEEQAVFHATAETPATMPGPGLVELMLRPDAKEDMDYLRYHGPPHLFVTVSALSDQADLFGLSPWLSDHMAELRGAYALTDWSPSGHIAHFTRRPTLHPDLFDLSPDAAPLLDGKAPDEFLITHGADMVGRHGRTINKPRDWIWRPSTKYAVVINLQPSPGPQPEHAAIISTHPNQTAGFVLYAVPGTAPVQWIIGSADGAAGVSSQPFVLPTDRPSRLVLRYSRRHITLTVDGGTVADLTPDATHHFIPALPITIGDWIEHTRPFAGVISEAYYYAQGVNP
ncbi:MAG: hypothetical protein WDN45_05290, partial [Caulobacteraceae bacterium]